MTRDRLDVQTEGTFYERGAEHPKNDARLVMIHGPRIGRSVNVHGVPLVLGRSSDADFQVDHPSVSRSHCAVWSEGDKVFVRDLGSKNGTWVNDNSVVRGELNVGDSVSLGEVMMRLVAGNSLEANYHEVLHGLATLDNLTKLCNRREFRERLDELVTRRMDGLDTCVVIFDVDHFKQINDRLGHDAGDDALRKVSEVLRHHMKETDCAGRLGGDEFGFILKGVNEKQAITWCNKLRKSMGKMGRIFSGDPPYMTISLGIAMWGDGMGSSELMKHADMALLRAKGLGKNRVCSH